MKLIIFLLIVFGLFPNNGHSDESLNDQLYLAVFRGTRDGMHDNRGLAENCINQGADVNAYYHTVNTHTALARPGEEITPLARAVEHGDELMIKLLLEHGADPNLPWKYNDEDPIVPLGLAANLMNLNGTQVAEIIKILLDHGAKVNAEYPKSHWTPLMHIALRNRQEAVEVLLDAGADINAKDYDGKTVLMRAAGNGLPDIVKLLLKHGADASLMDKINETALDIAIYQGKQQIVDVLIANKKGIGPGTLNAAMYEKSLGNLEKIIEAGADIDIQAEGSETVLMQAAEQGELDIVKMLLKHHAKVDIGAKNGGTAFIRAVAHQHSDIAKLLIDAGSNMVDHSNGNWGAIFTAAETGQGEIVSLMLDKGVGVDVRGNDDMTPLMAACDKGQMEVVKILLDHKADIEAVNSGRIMTDVGDNFIGTPLQWAEHAGHQDIAQYLISRGANQHGKK